AGERTQHLRPELVQQTHGSDTSQELRSLAGSVSDGQYSYVMGLVSLIGTEPGVIEVLADCLQHVSALLLGEPHTQVAWMRTDKMALTVVGGCEVPSLVGVGLLIPDICGPYDARQLPTTCIPLGTQVLGLDPHRAATGGTHQPHVVF